MDAAPGIGANRAMITTLAILMGALALAALVFWIMAIRLSYRIERLRDPKLPRPRLAYTNIVSTAFWPAKSGPEEQKLQPQLRLRLIAALACLLTMAVVSFALPLLAQDEKLIATSDGPAIIEFVHEPGTTLSYIRSNQNGSKPERILVHVAAPDELHVAKMVDRCTDAAYVTAKFFQPGEAVSLLVGGRLQRDSTQLPQAWLEAKPGELVVRVGDPSAEPMETYPMPTQPWRMYDFDLAEFALHGPRAKADFTFGLAMAWPDAAPPLVQILGDVQAKFLYSSDNGQKNHFRISGPAFTDPVVGDRGGEFITDAKYGHIIEARLGRPNHAGYSNFQLKLTSLAAGAEGEKAWKDALAAHWANCPAE